MQKLKFILPNEKIISKTFYYDFVFMGIKIYIEAEEDCITKITYNIENVNGERKQTKIIKSASTQLKEYFDGKRKTFDLRVKLTATTFQQKVYIALLSINYGSSISYMELAKLIGCKSARAVGNACKNNPVAIIVPCHRVIGKNLTLTGYNGGIKIKKALLDLEKINYNT